MKKLQFTFASDDVLLENLDNIRRQREKINCSCMLLELFTELPDKSLIEHVCAVVRDQLPDVLIAGCTSNGNILNGSFSGGSFLLACTMFEHPDTKVEILRFPVSAETQRETAEKLCAEVSKRPWVKGMEMLVTIHDMSVTDLCEGLSKLPAQTQVFGGAAFSDGMNRKSAFVFSGTEGCLEKGIVSALYGGNALHIETSFVTGWRPLGQFLQVTAASGEILKELNDRPAYETYYRYLHIKNDEEFFHNTLEFPFLYHCNGIDILRTPTESNPDGSLTMTAAISEGEKVRLAYGDPRMILDIVRREGRELQKFAPEGITVFSCAARRTFWGNREVGKETEVYQDIAPVSGFYTAGEFLRTNGYVNQHNVTQVIAAMREGEAVLKPQPEKEAEQGFGGKVSMITRMAMFIRATTEELVEANLRLEMANRTLGELAVTDAMTGMGNKTAYFDKIRELDEGANRESGSFSVAVFDLNGLKTINDSYGHESGDEAIQITAGILISVFGRNHMYRIGGDEFIAVLEEKSREEMEQLFGILDVKIAKANETYRIKEVPLSFSKGYAVFSPERDSAYRDVFRRADEAMYRDKAEYYKMHDRRRRR